MSEQTNQETAPSSDGIAVRGAMRPGYGDILTAEALAFLADLQRRFGPERDRLLAARGARQDAFDAGELPDFLPDTQEIRNGDWAIAGVPDDLQDRRVEITGPVDRKMVINALNSGASAFMADFEDATAPSWTNLMDGQVNLRDAVRRTISFDDSARGKQYRLNDETAVLLVRPRGWHLPEAHIEVDGAPMSGSLFDFGLYIFHNARAAVERGTGPYFYLPKLESYLEARLWNDVFIAAQDALGLPTGTIKATVLIETLPAAFQMEEILYELRDHIVGLNCGRWDYIFSYIKRLRAHPDRVLPDRSVVTMDRAFLRAYSKLLIEICHRRGAHAMGGMAAQIPIRGDEAANAAATGKVRADKEREASDGHDGTWVAHPGQVAVAREVFDRLMPAPNQVAEPRPASGVDRAALLELPKGEITEDGLRANIRVGVQYVEAWLGGRGCVPLYNLMEDAATAEISRAQIWQWLRHGAKLNDGRTVDTALFQTCLDEEMAALRAARAPGSFDTGHLAAAIEIFQEMSTNETFEEFLTIPAYRRLIADTDSAQIAAE